MLRNTLNTVITATLIMLLGVSSTAQAIVPMGNLMGSTSMTWGDQEETTYSSTLRVDLVPAKPTIQQISIDPSDEQPPGEPVTVTYTITSTANGPDDYTLAAPYDSDADGIENVVGDLTTKILDAGDVEITESMNLGATAATGPADPDGTTITVPSDGGEGTVVNGISAGDKVVIGQDYGNPYEVKNVAEDGNTATIELTHIVAAVIELGTRIAEQKTFQVVVSGVALADPAASGAVSLAVTAQTADGTQTGRASLDFTVTANPIERSFERYARNIDNDRAPIFPIAGGVDGDGVYVIQFDSGDGPEWYFKEGDYGRKKTEKREEGVSAEEGDEVEILIVINAGNLADQPDIILKETVSRFVEYVAGSAKFGGRNLDDGWRQLDLVTFKVVAPLNIAKNTSAHLTYRVKVMGGGDEVRLTQWGDVWPVGCKRIDMRGLCMRSSGVDCHDSTPFQEGEWEECKGAQWNIAKGEDPQTNPVCWAHMGYQENLQGGWVVGENSQKTNEIKTSLALLIAKIPPTMSTFHMDPGAVRRLLEGFYPESSAGGLKLQGCVMMKDW